MHGKQHNTASTKIQTSEEKQKSKQKRKLDKRRRNANRVPDASTHICIKICAHTARKRTRERQRGMFEAIELLIAGYRFVHRTMKRKNRQAAPEAAQRHNRVFLSRWLLPVGCNSIGRLTHHATHEIREEWENLFRPCRSFRLQTRLICVIRPNAVSHTH